MFRTGTCAESSDFCSVSSGSCPLKSTCGYMRVSCAPGAVNSSFWPACNSLLPRPVSQEQSLHHHLDRRRQSRKLRHVRTAYVIERHTGVSKERVGITHSLQDIARPDFNIAHVKRQAPSGIDFRIAVQGQSAFKAAVSCSYNSVKEAVEKLLSQSPQELQLKALSSDIQQVISLFLHASGFEAVDAALSIVTQTSCPRFHADHVELRCLCTYFGEGTYFAPNRAVDRRMWMRALGIQDTKGFGIKTQCDVQQASAWDILVLKGNAFPGNQGAGAVHKSPSASQDSPRLLLTLDKAQDYCCSKC